VRSRDFSKNNEYGRKFFALVQSNIIGHAGIGLKFACRRPDGSIDEADSRRLDRAWARWWRRGELDVTGKLSGPMLENLLVKMVARDGEVLVRFVEGRDQGVHRIRLQVLPAHLLDETNNRELGDGRRIRMGVEFDAFMKPVAYHLRTLAGTADMHGTASQKYERVPASEIIHLFVPEEIEQWRGVPWAHVALRGANHLDKFEEAALIAANVGAAKMGFFQQKDPEAAPIGSAEGDGEGEAGSGNDFITEVAPGTFDLIPDGYELASYNPQYPNEVFDPFTKAVARRLSTGLLTSYHSVTGDLTGVNYSSIRAGTLDDRDMWKLLQGWFIADFREALTTRWLARAMMFDPELKALPQDKFDKFNAPVFQPRRWEWVDPQSDMTANEKSVALGIKSRAQIIRESGGDPDQVWAELDAEKERGLGLPSSSAPQQPAQQNPQATE
jgi:lambda family phage portal protein